MSDDWRKVLLKDYRPACAVVVNNEPADRRNVRSGLAGVWVNARGYPMNRTDETVVGRWYLRGQLAVELPTSAGPRPQSLVSGSMFALLTDHSLRVSVVNAKRETSELGAFAGAFKAKDKVRVLVFEWPYADMDAVSLVTGLERAVGIGGGEARLVVGSASECKPDSWSFKLRSDLRGFSTQLQAAIAASRPDAEVEQGNFSGGLLGREQQVTFGDSPSTASLGLSLRQAPDASGWLTVEQLDAGGPAELGGVQVGDELAAVGGRQVHTIAEVAKVLQGKKQGENVTLICFRAGERRRCVGQLT